jgi:Protein of unknown function (DUF2840)
MEPHLTRVETLRLPRIRPVSLRLGRPLRRDAQGQSQRVHTFAPESVFALLRWHADEEGTARSQLSILHAVLLGEAASTIPGVTPGADILLQVSRVAHVRSMLDLIRAIMARGIAAAAVSHDDWCCVHHRVLARVPVPEYSVAARCAYVGRLGCRS